MRLPATRLLRFLLVVLLTAPIWLVAARASCAPPDISIDSFVVRPGDRAVVTGRSWTDTCDDTGGGNGCTEDGFDPGNPVQDIRLVLEKKGSNERTFLTEVDTGPGFGFRTEIVIPDVGPGVYRIVDDDGLGYFEPGTIRIRRAPSG